MNKPTLYLQNIEDIEERSKYFLENYVPLLRLNNNRKKRILDIGCGPGNVTHDIVYPYFQCEIEELLGIDKSEPMIEYAKTTYKDKQISFRVLDVLHSNLEEFNEYFDYVVSFWALHWIQDQTKLYNNIFNILKPGSDLLATSIANSELYEVYRTVWYKPVYYQYIKDFTGLCPYFQSSQNPTEQLRTILEKVGFKIHVCELMTWRMSKTPNFKDFLISINGAYEQIPKHLREKFIMDHIKEMERRQTFQHNGNFFIDFNLFAIYATKH